MKTDTMHATIVKHKKLMNAFIEVTSDWITTIQSLPKKKNKLENV